MTASAAGHALVSATEFFPVYGCCRTPLHLDEERRSAVCPNRHCGADAEAAGDVVGYGPGQPGRGMPRPVIDGLPVPWVTPIVGGVPAWVCLHAARETVALRERLCQLCGDALDPHGTACVAVDAGLVQPGGALHPRCLRLARRLCPALRTRTRVRYVHLPVAALPIADADLLGHLAQATENHTGPLPTDIVLTPARQAPAAR